MNWKTVLLFVMCAQVGHDIVWWLMFKGVL